MAPANPALPGHPSGCAGATGGACVPSCPPPATFVPVTDVQLDEAVEHARLVQDLGVAGAPGAAYALAQFAPAMALELRSARRSGPPSMQAVDAAIWRDRALRAEKRCTALGVAGEDLLRELADERGTREGLEAKLRETKARVAELEAACRETQARGEALIAQLRGSAETLA